MAFRGGHSDIGGGYRERGLANIVIEWMIDQGGRNFRYPGNVYSSKMARHQETALYYTYGNRRLGGVPNHPSVSKLTEYSSSDDFSFWSGIDLSKKTYGFSWSGYTGMTFDYKIGDKQF